MAALPVLSEYRNTRQSAIGKEHPLGEICKRKDKWMTYTENIFHFLNSHKNFSDQNLRKIDWKELALLSHKPTRNRRYYINVGNWSIPSSGIYLL